MLTSYWAFLCTIKVIRVCRLVVTIYQIKVLETGVKICMSVQDTFFAKNSQAFMNSQCSDYSRVENKLHCEQRPFDLPRNLIKAKP